MRFHVGEYLQDELDARNWSTRDCAERMGGNVDVDHLTLDLTIASWQAPEEHSAKQTTMARETAEGLARAFGTDAETWLRLDEAYRAPDTAEGERELI